MYKALVLITDAEGGRSIVKTALKVELTDTDLGRLVGRVKKHLEIVEQETRPAAQVDLEPHGQVLTPAQQTVSGFGGIPVPGINRPVRDNPQA